MDLQNKKPDKILKEFSDNSKNVSLSSIFWDFWAPLFLTIGLYSGIRTYVAEARYIPSGSMLPGLQIKDRLLIEKLTFRRRSPRRGEIVVFKSPYSFNSELLSRRSKKLPSSGACAVLSFPLVSSIIGLRDPACDAYIKRIVALGGDEVLINKKGEVFVNGFLVKEPYVSDYCSLDLNGQSSCVPLNTVVPFAKVLVLGDNRRNSWDSRFWPGSPFLPEKEILGRAVFRFWPINRIGILGH
tara:strand:+ start:73 stop:795 length:723 start_codon:yes stop_codon:yes gene_type:complete